MKHYYFFYFLILISVLDSNAQEFIWAKQFGQDKFQKIHSIAIDDQGNSYIQGSTFASTTDLNPGEGIFNLSHPGVQWFDIADVFLVKLDPDGNFLWGKGIAENYSNDNRGYHVKIGSDGFVYTLSVLYQPDTNGLTIKKYDSAGNLMLSKNIPILGGNGTYYSTSFDIDNSSNIYLGGYFSNTVILDPNNTELTMVSQESGTFILKLNASGNYEWVKTFTDYQSAATTPSIIAVRPDGNLNFIVGSQLPNDEGTGFNKRQSLYNIDAENNTVLWEKHFLNQTPQAFAIGPDGNIIIAGSFENDIIDVDPSNNEHILDPLNNYSNDYILWLSPEGNFVDVAVYYGEWDSFWISQIAVSGNSDYFITGSFNGNFDFNPESEELILSSDTQEHAMVIKFDDQKQFETAYKIGTGSVFAINSTVILGDHVYLGGHFTGGADMDPNTQEYWFDDGYNGIFGGDGYIMKLGTATLAIDKQDYLSNVVLYPNPATDSITISMKDISAIPGEIVIVNSLGIEVLRSTLFENVKLDVSNLSAGVYYLKILGNVSFTKKIIKQ
jgi:hypothetical protein